MKKTNGQLWKLSVSTTRESEEAVAELLGSLMQLPTVIHQNTITGKTLVSVFCPRRTSFSRRESASLREGIRRIRESGLQAGSGRVSIRKVRVEDWRTSWKRHFQPWSPGKTLLVRPSWSKLKPLKGQAVLTLDPGLSFGTGQHPTTRFCLKQLVRLRRSGESQSLLDMGCGSGILSIGAALLDYSPVHAFDFDPEAVRIASANARLNRVEKRVKPAQADLTRLPLRSRETYDVVCANLIYDLLIQERRRILNRVKPGGVLVLAGILKEQFPAVEEAFRSEGWLLVRGRTEGEWRSGMFQQAAQDGRRALK